MKCAVIKIVISLIIRGICSAADDIGNQLVITDGPSTRIQSCVAKVIEHILNPTEGLVFVISSHPDYLPNRLPNPVTILNMKEPLPTNYKRYEVNYVIEAESWALLLQAMRTIFRSPLWHPMETPKGKFVMLIKEEKALQTIFWKLWDDILTLHIIVVIYEDTFKNCPIKVIMSNPQAKGNNCGRKPPTVFSNFSCDDNISLEFLNPIRNYNGCPVYIRPTRPLFEFNLNTKGDRVMYNLLAGLKRALNVTILFLFGQKMKIDASHGKGIVIMENFFGEFDSLENSIIFSRSLFTWMGSPGTRISPLNTIFLPFKYDLWIAVLFITILMILLKWMIMKGNGYNNNYVNLACAFTDIIGLSFGVCVNRIPNIWSLKLLLAFFLVYVIHIHTAYTSDLINILTEPRYEGLIRNVEEVANSGLPIFMSPIIAYGFFRNANDGGRLLRKINNLTIVSDDLRILRSINDVTNRFVVCNEDHARIPGSESKLNNRYLRKTKVNTFLTNDLSGEIKRVFALRNGSYFAESLNALITHLWESGTQEADAHLNPMPSLPVQRKESEAATMPVVDRILKDMIVVQPLRLKDLLPIFVIFLICLSFCIIIFVAEILVHKIVAHITRNQVVPLNV